MPKFQTVINKNYSNNNFSMKEKSPITKINLRGDLNNKEFSSRIGKILNMILPKKSCTTSTREKITSLWLGPNEWLLVSNDLTDKENNDYALEEFLFKEISKTNLGAVTNVSDHFTIFSLSGSHIFEILSKGSPFNFNDENFSDNKVVQTLLNNVDVTIHKKNKKEVDLYVRRSFANYLWDWIQNSALFI